MKITLSSRIKIRTTPDNEQQIIKQFTFANPKYQDAISFGRSTRDIDRNLCLIDREVNRPMARLIAPIGILDYLLQTFSPEVNDERCTIKVSIPFTGALRPYQLKFVNDALIAKGGLMIAATGAGKTVSGIALASRLQQRTLILVKSKDLAKQWMDAIKQFTGLDAGLIGGGKNSEGEQFTIGLTQSLCKRDCSQLNYGLVIADECHNLPACQAFTVINGLNAKYKYGLSATPQRRDNMEFMIHGALGDVCAEINQDQLQGKVLPVCVQKIQHEFNADVESWTDFLNVLVDDESRNLIIVGHAIKASKAMGTVILCAQIRHCELLASLCHDRDAKALVLHGQLPAKVRAERMAQAPDAQLIIGTLSLLSEGIDLPHLSALIFGAPVSASVDRETPAATRLIQSIGRCRRPYPNKSKAFVLDIIDKCGFGVSAWNKRVTIYQQQGFKVMRG
ncbi:DEAD/DEAH box helicase [methanotrophic endosymbiont of Bathymodiolus puteoserpentis (Logatchev)]|jgi:superfamily II DNA or RNA helicase|uniref:DEAD/DEAH box helicase n=1 Tax=methanotrophic endosymbiont of Bathymodiolus puteoserpentis (Logatchev) TaxID=343235 RepID=UPI0013C695AB|nr:DEAD/DEAH box helicase [methanotrophic endosymbiont of Bathymodiolus puteoserpentis (Logatchev)]SHE19268.1 Helicase-like:Type III restriction enzyme, res subunit:DEAD/DEAH box helicase-like [methanotrophic endosymbiont of Bathymodiolus puteoserpentis (Logatchev)]